MATEKDNKSKETESKTAAEKRQAEAKTQFKPDTAPGQRQVNVSDRPIVTSPLREPPPPSDSAELVEGPDGAPISKKTQREMEAGRAAAERNAERLTAGHAAREAEEARLKGENITATEATAGTPKTQMEAINKDWTIKAEAETDAVAQARSAAGRADAPKTAHDIREAEIQRAADVAVAERAIAEKDVSVESPQVETPEGEKTVAEKVAAEALKESETERAQRAADEKARVDQAKRDPTK